ncbi:hypothetical protein BDR03DRAFT_972597 [Suillus americanus]|nr:hypothetical protein BDR03DRAFT_972597 [Suillus americanus]
MCPPRRLSVLNRSTSSLAAVHLHVIARFVFLSVIPLCTFAITSCSPSWFVYLLPSHSSYIPKFPLRTSPITIPLRTPSYNPYTTPSPSHGLLHARAYNVWTGSDNQCRSTSITYM